MIVVVQWPENPLVLSSSAPIPTKEIHYFQTLTHTYNISNLIGKYTKNKDFFFCLLYCKLPKVKLYRLYNTIRTYIVRYSIWLEPALVRTSIINISQGTHHSQI